MKTILKHLQANLVAIISLVVAVTAINISTMRANVSEDQHNIRDASFRVLSELSQLQLLIDNSHYGVVQGISEQHQATDLKAANPIEGWARVNYMRDLAVVIPSPVPDSLEALFNVWSSEFDDLGSEDREASLAANKAISTQITLARNDVKSVLISLK